MKNFSFEKNKNIYIIRYKEWELCMDIEKEIIINNKTGEIIDYETWSWQQKNGDRKKIYRLPYLFIFFSDVNSYTRFQSENIAMTFS